MTSTTTEDDGHGTTALREKARAAAVATLKAKHPNEFSELFKIECEARGVEYKPRLTAEERAAKEVADLLTKFPSLRERIAPPTAD